MAIHPVILSGGSGTRLWPLSRTSLPKQLLPLTSELSLLQETVLRVAQFPEIAPPLLVCNHEHRFLIAEQLRMVAVAPSGILLEPLGRNTAPAAAIAALKLSRADADAILLVLPSDHVIKNHGALLDAVLAAAQAASNGYIVTFGITPSGPATGYGYIESSEAIEGIPGCHGIREFTEKPDLATAERFLASGQHYWNSGMFVFSARYFLEELRRLQPALMSACEQALDKAIVDLEFTRLDPDTFSACTSISIDYAVMEHTPRGAVLPVELGWSDVGSWDALWQVNEKNGEGNVLHGDVVTDNVTNTLIKAQNRMVAAVGVQDLVIIETSDAVLVAHKSESQNVKRIVDQLHAAARTEHISHRRVYRPWGWYESVDQGERFQVKRLMVNPGARLSLQLHHHRAEHWVVVTGTARVHRDGKEMLLSENESTYIPIGASHRLENPGKVPLHIIEVQSGCYLGEDDIVRIEDSYNRA
jgi:mannose-1-phosphate guanylyltransferase / mannose-6-phosphate isomerase